jgi:hypothetical protein
VTRKTLAIYALVCGTATLAGLIMATLSFGWETTWNALSGQTAAAWVQAVGSIIAIGVAIALPASQYARERRREDIERQRTEALKYDRAVNCAAELLALLGRLRVRFQLSTSSEFFELELQTFLAQISRLEADELPASLMARASEMRDLERLTQWPMALATASPPRQNSCRPDRTKNPGAMMRRRVGPIRKGVQGQSGGEAVAAGERAAGNGLA